MKTPIKLPLAAAALIGVLALDHFYYKPMKAEELRQEEKHLAECLSKLAEIKETGGDAAREQRSGRLMGCDFGSPLG